MFKHILITGGAGFVGSNLAVRLKQTFADLKVTALDNLKRRGSELALARLREHGVEFAHGDVRCAEDFDTVSGYDLLIDCSAEPSVQAGASGSPAYVLNTNLSGTIQCLEAARREHAAFLFLSTSRVYPISTLNAASFTETETRFTWSDPTGAEGITTNGVSEKASLEGARSFYGASKLAGELLLSEYVATHGMKAIINRCGILAGPWQMGKVDQGVVTLWVARHIFKKPLSYTGFGGTGKQLRDMLHVEDLFDLVCKQMAKPELWDGRVYNAGGGLANSVSLCELTKLCQTATGNTIEIGAKPETSPVDLRIYVTDSSRVSKDFGWKPQRSVPDLVEDITRWVHEHADSLAKVLG